MEQRRQLRCLIAAGGTVGHVAPSLAVAEALSARGVEVTFAGSPDRVEAPLVSQLGYAFDAFGIAGFPPPPRAEPPPPLALAPAAPVVLVFGGSLGALLLNELAVEAWANEGPTVVHVCGERDYASLKPRVSRPDYHLLPFLERIGVAYAASDVAVARAGGSVWEL